MLSNRWITGASLIELMISMALGFASLTAMSSLVGHGVGLNNSLMAKSRLEEEVNAVMAVISQDIKRLGYLGLTEDLVVDPTIFINPFANSLVISEFPKEDKNSCITFAYDRDQNGLLDNKVINEQFGFRLKDKAIEIRVDGYQCTESYWQDLTDSKVVKITKLEFTSEKLQQEEVAQLRIQVVLQAQLVKYPEYSKHLSSQFVIKNYD
ncbi:prepilin peptidase dependent protein B [Paraglaciecola sp. L3A3]|uniref:prepilin peptidase dependent protein B n=1 Tax=Paraglaciecola sp. L3A3 TaxID=2686358 RepID=UPI00131B60FA|nr:prepilin peptidase dependent protein B [Paraglaciecola sp. L3A3]